MAHNCGPVFPWGVGGWGVGASVNNGIDPDKFTLHNYSSVDQVICMVSKFGKGVLMPKFDVEAVYCNIAVHQLTTISWA